jgi:hypothetical protein
MLTPHNDTITAEVALPGDIMFADADRRVPQRGSRPGSSRGKSRVNPNRRMPLVLVLEDGHAISIAMRQICDFLEIPVDRISSADDLLPCLERCQPMAVVAAMDAIGQDGGNVLMTVACHDPNLPVLLMTGGDAALAGAVDAVIGLWGLTEVVQTATWPSPGAIAEFLCRAGMRGNCLALMPV